MTAGDATDSTADATILSGLGSAYYANFWMSKSPSGDGSSREHHWAVSSRELFGRWVNLASLLRRVRDLLFTRPYLADALRVVPPHPRSIGLHVAITQARGIVRPPIGWGTPTGIARATVRLHFGGPWNIAIVPVDGRSHRGPWIGCCACRTIRILNTGIGNLLPQGLLFDKRQNSDQRTEVVNVTVVGVPGWPVGAGVIATAAIHRQLVICRVIVVISQSKKLPKKCWKRCEIEPVSTNQQGSEAVAKEASSCINVL